MKKFIEGITAEEAQQEIAELIEDEYRFGRLIDQNRMRDLEHTIKVLESRQIMENLNERPMRVCLHCLWGIEAHEGNQSARAIYVDEEDEEESFCDWCEESGFDTLYEI